MIILLTNDIFGKNLRYLRGKKKLSQKTLSQLTGVSAYTIRWIEWGRMREVDAGLLESLCKAVDGEMNEMLSTDLWEGAK